MTSPSWLDAHRRCPPHPAIPRRVVLLGGLATLCPMSGAAAPPPGKIHRIGIVGTSLPVSVASGPQPSVPTVAALLRSLSDLGYLYDRDFVTEPRSAEGRLDRIPGIAAELARLKVDVIVAGGPALTGLKEAKIAIPIVMAAASDPVRLGLVRSLAQPGGHFTGLSMQAADLDRKRLELLGELVP